MSRHESQQFTVLDITLEERRWDDMGVGRSRTLTVTLMNSIDVGVTFSLPKRWSRPMYWGPWRNGNVLAPGLDIGWAINSLERMEFDEITDRQLKEMR